MKLTKPLKFVTGRIDCDSCDETIDCISAENIKKYNLADAGFVTCKAEVSTLTDVCIHTARFLVRHFGLYSPNH